MCTEPDPCREEIEQGVEILLIRHGSILGGNNPRELFSGLFTCLPVFLLTTEVMMKGLQDLVQLAFLPEIGCDNTF